MTGVFGRVRARAGALFREADPWPLWLAIGAFLVAGRLLVAQADTLRFPLQGEHNWREAVTYSVAYNFRHESFDFLRPRLDLTRGKTGITGMEAPVVPLVVGAAMRIFGDAPGVARTTVWVTALLGLWAS